VSTRLLSFIAGRDDVYFGVTIPQLQDVKREVPEAICDSYLVNGSRNLIVNRDKPPFDNPDLRRAMSLTLDCHAFIDIISTGRGAIGGPMEPPPEGLWGMPAEMLEGPAGLQPRCRAATRRSAADHGETWLRPRQTDCGHRRSAQCSGLAGPGVDPDRPAESDLHRW
jgi:hypothetical protein